MNNEKQNKKPALSGSKRELHKERLATTDEAGNRVYLYPESVEGVWKNRRHFLYWALIILFLVLPWIYIGEMPLLFLDVGNQNFYLLGNVWHGIEPVFIFLLMVSGLFFVAFMTSILGRVWCGWACPQTVFIQAVFMKIETLIEGSARTRRDLDRSKMSAEKFFKKSLKWLLFTAISFYLSLTLISYFIEAKLLFSLNANSPLYSSNVYITALTFTSILLLDFGWFREQFCIIACPYGRMQSVMMDPNSLVILYDEKRGEPRRGTVERNDEGDCINCFNCVKVCPTGIDIRRGTQLECIACTLCIDACDEIMDKIKKPRGLIRYGAETERDGKKHSFITLRSIIYVIISIIMLFSLFIFINKSSDLKLQFYRGTDAPYQETFGTDGSKIIINHFTMKVTHQGDKQYIISLRPQDKSLNDKIEIVTVMKPLKFDKAMMKTPIFFKFNPSILKAHKHQLILEIVEEEKVISTVEVPLVGPDL